MSLLQDLFDTVSDHLLKQKRKSKLAPEDVNEDDNGTGCAYRGEGGLKCAVGILIDDNVYETRLENLGVGNSEVLHALRASGWGVAKGSKAEKLLSDLQVIHDTAFVKNWKEELTELAEKNKLKLRGTK